MVSRVAIPNAAGRVLWPWLSDHIGPRWVFLLLMALQAAMFLLLPLTHTIVAFTPVAGAVMFCFGAGFGTMPTFAADYFGDEHVGQIDGLLLAPMGIAALFGPWMLANTREHTGSYAPALYLLTLILLVSAILPWIVRPRSLIQPPSTPTPEARGSGRSRRCEGWLATWGSVRVSGQG